MSLTPDQERILNEINMMAAPGERATVAMLNLILSELVVIRDTQLHHAALFSAVTCGGTRMATEAM